LGFAGEAGFGAGPALAAGAGFAAEPGFAAGAALTAGAGFAAAVALAAGVGFAGAAGLVVAEAFAVEAGFTAAAGSVEAVVFVAGAVLAVEAGRLGDEQAGPGPAGRSGVQTCSAALALTLSAVSRSWPIPAKTARNTTTGASLMRSLTCGIGMVISPWRACMRFR
jgi:hypothetical protein